MTVIHIKYKDPQIHTALNKLLRAGTDLSPVMKVIAGHLADSTQQSFEREKAPDGLDDVIIRKDKLPHIVERGKGDREQFANYILPALQDPLEVWLTEGERYTATGRKQRIYRRRFIALFGDNKDKQGLAVVQENKDGSLLWTFVPHPLTDKKGHDKTYLDNKRAGFLLYRKGGDQ